MLLCLVASACDGVQRRLRPELAEPALARGWRLAVTLTPNAAAWLDATGELAKLRALTDLPVRSVGRMPGEPSPYGVADRYLFVPASANSVAKLALGIADNQALTQLCAAVGLRYVPVVLRPQADDAHRGHPAFAGHLATLRSLGVQVNDAQPSEPWTSLLDVVAAATGRSTT
jgi:hypothetical protein